MRIDGPTSVLTDRTFRHGPATPGAPSTQRAQASGWRQPGLPRESPAPTPLVQLRPPDDWVANLWLNRRDSSRGIFTDERIELCQQSGIALARIARKILTINRQVE